MNKESYFHVCLESEAGRDAFVSHPSTNEEGIVTRCIPQSDHIVVQTPDSQKRCWDYRECETMQRSPQEWPRR